ncbi:polysaccharide lyase 8 family protein [Nonomuraea sp. NBC_01738]|uniref:polysaccharide lyase 8 family protein n=1 Tax=Nonomuraea sp. NBC_01738 TaxID=2976003 RepID=UPI002E13EA80|nr:polysaccharide lyase 8 family protein [Nonomuraea sp. NBC_01738]
MAGLSRRSVLRLGAAALTSALGSDGDPFDLLRRRWREVTAWDATSSPLLARARVAARTGDAGLAGAVAAEIAGHRRRVYHAGADAEGNWWDWEIGTPKRLLDAAVLVGLGGAEADALAGAVDYFVPVSRLEDDDGRSTGANRVDLCMVMLLRAMLTGDRAKAEAAVSALSPVLHPVTSGDGYYRDGSFIQHAAVPYQGGYGVVLLSGLARLFAVLRGSPWEVSSQAVFDLVEGSFAPFVHDGFCMDLVRGRGISRGSFGDHRRGRELASAVLLLGESASVEERRRWQGLVKGWMVRGRPGLAVHPRVTKVVADPAVPALSEAVGHRLMPMSARAVHRRPGWCAALSMASEWVAHYEHGNGENPRGWHTGAGMLYWWAGGHGDQYSDGFWATVDPYRLPGTTASARRLPDGAGEAWGGTCPPARWVGGATDGEYATVGQHLYGLESTLEAFRSWFFLDDCVLCLGAGITSRDGVPYETIVDNRRTDATLTVDIPAGWAHLDGHGGYVSDGALRTSREERGGRSYVTLSLGDTPAYRYLLMPGATAALTRARALDPGWAAILANTSSRQGVHVPALGLSAVNFWQPGRAGPLTASAPAAVLIRERGDGTATVSVADPRRDLDELTVTWDRPVNAVLRGSPHLTGFTTGESLTLRFGRLADEAGATVTITVAVGPLRA